MVKRAYEQVNCSFSSMIFINFLEFAALIYGIVIVWDRKNSRQYTVGKSKGFDDWWLLAFVITVSRVMQFAAIGATLCSKIMLIIARGFRVMSIRYER